MPKWTESKERLADTTRMNDTQTAAGRIQRKWNRKEKTKKANNHDFSGVKRVMMLFWHLCKPDTLEAGEDKPIRAVKSLNSRPLICQSPLSNTTARNNRRPASTTRGSKSFRRGNSRRLKATLPRVKQTIKPISTVASLPHKCAQSILCDIKEK